MNDAIGFNVPCNNQLWRRHIGIVMIKSCKRRKLSFLCKWTWYCESHVQRLPKILSENKMRHKLFLCAVCKIASIECSCLPSATKWVQCDCECAVERLGSGGAGALIPNVQLVTPGRYTPLRGTTTRYTSLCTWTFLMWKHIVERLLCRRTRIGPHTVV